MSAVSTGERCSSLSIKNRPSLRICITINTHHLAPVSSLFAMPSGNSAAPNSVQCLGPVAGEPLTGGAECDLLDPAPPENPSRSHSTSLSTSQTRVEIRSAVMSTAFKKSVIGNGLALTVCQALFLYIMLYIY